MNPKKDGATTERVPIHLHTLTCTSVVVGLAIRNCTGSVCVLESGRERESVVMHENDILVHLRYFSSDDPLSDWKG